jgi:hypothetical protein
MAMDATKPARGLVLAGGLATVVGWHGVLVAAAVIFWLGLSDASPGGDCTDFSCAWTPRDLAMLVAIFVGPPMLATSVLVASAVVAGLAAARVRSGVLAGTVGTLTGWLGAAIVLLTRFQSAIQQ